MLFKSRGFYWLLLVAIITLLTLEATLKAQALGDGETGSAPPPNPPTLSSLSLLYTRQPQGLAFAPDGTPATAALTGWNSQGYTSENKKLFFNGPAPGSSRDYIELTRGSNGEPNRYVMMGARVRFSEFNVANVVGKNIGSTTRCTSESVSEPTKMTCWTLNKPICEAILKSAKVENPDQLLGKLKECVDLTSAVGAIEAKLVDDSKKIHDANIAAIKAAKGLEGRSNNISFQFDNPAKENGSPYLWLKYLAIASSCSAILGSPSENATLDDIFKKSGFKGAVEQGDGKMPGFPGH